MNVACNSPDTVSHRVSTSLELQRLRVLLKIHSIELHAKLLRGCALARTRDQWHARGSDGTHAGPMARAWDQHLARGPDTWRLDPVVCAWAAPWRISRGWRACRGVNAHCQRFMCERHARSGVVGSKSQTALPRTRHCQRLLPKWFVLWAPRCPEA